MINDGELMGNYWLIKGELMVNYFVKYWFINGQLTAINYSVVTVYINK